MQEPDTDAPGHGKYHRANNALQRELWALLQGPVPDTYLAAAIDKVYTRYDQNYLNGPLYHWPYLDCGRAVDLCERLVRQFPESSERERVLWLKAFALRVGAADAWPDAERDLETYANQVRWKADFEKARETYRRLAADYPTGRYGKAAAALAGATDLGIMLPRGPREPDPREP